MLEMKTGSWASLLEESTKPRVVLSGVNLREGGSLSIFRDALTSLRPYAAGKYEIVALVKSRELFDTPGVTYLEFPTIMKSWSSRVWFEYWTARKISSQLRPKLWLSMHDTTPNVIADVRAVYCQNASPFYRTTWSEFLLDWHFGMFTLFYRYLYRINIHANRYVIVQQEWMRQAFEEMYGVGSVVVAHPEIHASASAERTGDAGSTNRRYRFFYPMFPRTYKNPEVLLQAARILEQRRFSGFELWLTFDAGINKYAASVVKQFADVRAVRWLGKVSRERVLELYGEADCLLFPSRLESWGLPLSEFRPFDKPMLVADLPYAHETCAGYPQVRFFDPNDPAKLADLMEQAVRGIPIFGAVLEPEIPQPFARNWLELWKILLGEATEPTAVGARQLERETL